jgi:hypothetical protein
MAAGPTANPRRRNQRIRRTKLHSGDQAVAHRHMPRKGGTPWKRFPMNPCGKRNGPERILKRVWHWRRPVSSPAGCRNGIILIAWSPGDRVPPGLGFEGVATDCPFGYQRATGRFDFAATQDRIIRSEMLSTENHTSADGVGCFPRCLVVRSFHRVAGGTDDRPLARIRNLPLKCLLRKVVQHAFDVATQLWQGLGKSSARSGRSKPEPANPAMVLP